MKKIGIKSKRPGWRGWMDQLQEDVVYHLSVWPGWIVKAILYVLKAIAIVLNFTLNNRKKVALVLLSFASYWWIQSQNIAYAGDVTWGVMTWVFVVGFCLATIIGSYFFYRWTKKSYRAKHPKKPKATATGGATGTSGSGSTKSKWWKTGVTALRVIVAVVTLHVLCIFFARPPYGWAIDQPIFWVDHVVIIGVVLFFREMSAGKNPRMTLTWPGTAILFGLFLVNGVTIAILLHKNDEANARIRIAREEILQAGRPLEVSSSLEEFTIIAPVGNYSRAVKIPWPKWGFKNPGGAVTFRRDDGVEVKDHPTDPVEIGSTRTLEVQSRAEKPVEVTVFKK